MIPWTFSTLGCSPALIYNGGTVSTDTSKFGTATGYIVHQAVDITQSSASVTVIGGNVPTGLTNCSFRVFPML